MSDLTNPHDRFFKATFSQRDLALSYFTNYLPAALTAELDLAAHQLVPGEFFDDHLRGHLSDLLFHVPLKSGESAYVYLLFEHKSSPDRWVGLQLLRYKSRIWEKVL